MVWQKSSEPDNNNTVRRKKTNKVCFVLYTQIYKKKENYDDKNLIFSLLDLLLLLFFQNQKVSPTKKTKTQPIYVELFSFY